MRARLAAFPLLLGLLAGCASKPPASSEAPHPQVGVGERGNRSPYRVLGRTYHVLSTAEGYREVGIASWYGPNFDGRPTSSGEIFDMNEMTAAHKTLPLPTRARVTHLGNGRSIEVRINDRGPFKDDRIIDLSYAAARALDMINEGTARVQVVALDQPDEARRPVVIEAQGVFLQLGAFAQRDNALAMLQRLRRQGVEGVQVVTSPPEQEPLVHRVRIGPLPSADDAERLAARLAGLGYEQTRVVFE